MFLPHLLAGSLAAAGFKVLVNSEGMDPAVPVVRGRIDRYFLEPKLNFFGSVYETDIDLKLTVQTGRGFRATRRFYSKGDEATILGSETDMQASSDRAVREILITAVGAIANLMDRYPAASAPDVAGTAYSWEAPRGWTRGAP